jgi:hypothetical protein
MSKANELVTNEEYERKKKEESKAEVDKLLKSEAYQKFQAIKEGR